MKYFYAHIVVLTDISGALDVLDLTPKEKTHLVEIIESSIHHAIVDAVMSELSADAKITFLDHLAADRHDEIWDLLSSHIQNPEKKIKQTAEDLKKELLSDVLEALTAE